MSSFNKMKGVNPVPQPAEPRQPEERTPKPSLMVKPPGPVWMMLNKEAQDAITQRAKEAAQALATWEAAQAQEAADDQIEAERSASSTRPRSEEAEEAAAAEEAQPQLTGWRLNEELRRIKKARKQEARQQAACEKGKGSALS